MFQFKFFICLFAVLDIEPRALPMLANHSFLFEGLAKFSGMPL